MAVWKPKVQKKTVVYDGFCAYESDKKNILGAEESCNCDCENGVLTTGFGVTPYVSLYGTVPTINQSEKLSWIFQHIGLSSDKLSYLDQTCYMTARGALYLLNLATGGFKSKSVFAPNTVPETIVKRSLEAKTAFVGEKGVAIMNVSEAISATTIKNAYPAVAYFKNRLFIGVGPCTLVYSNPETETAFTETGDNSGRISFSERMGKIEAIRALGNFLYVLFEYGIVRLDVGGGGRDFKVTILTYAGEKIFGRSACVCGNAIFFLTEGGVYRFDGTREIAEKVCEGLRIKPLKSTQLCGRASVDGKYMVRYLDESDTKRVAVITADGKSGYYTGGDLDGLWGNDGKAYCRVDNMIQYVDPSGDLPSGEEYRFVTRWLDFGSSKKKTLRTLRFEGSGSFTLTVENGKKSKEKKIQFVDGKAEIRLDDAGTLFRLRFVLDKGAEVSKMAAETETLKNVK